MSVQTSLEDSHGVSPKIELQTFIVG